MEPERFRDHIRYRIRHKWLMFWECSRYAIRALAERKVILSLYLIRQAVWHDVSYFFPPEILINLKRYGRKNDDQTHFRLCAQAWHYHQASNKHHWNYWARVSRQGLITVLEMPERYMIEMFCDWHAANKIKGHHGDIRAWYLAERKRGMILHPRNRIWIERELGIGSSSGEAGDEKVYQIRYVSSSA